MIGGRQITIRLRATKDFLLEKKIASQAKLDEIAAEIAKYLQAELDIADAAPFPAGISAAYDVFDNSIVEPAFKKKVLEN